MQLTYKFFCSKNIATAQTLPCDLSAHNDFPGQRKAQNIPTCPAPLLCACNLITSCSNLLLHCTNGLDVAQLDDPGMDVVRNVVGLVVDLVLRVKQLVSSTGSKQCSNLLACCSSPVDRERALCAVHDSIQVLLAVCVVLDNAEAGSVMEPRIRQLVVPNACAALYLTLEHKEVFCVSKQLHVCSSQLANAVMLVSSSGLDLSVVNELREGRALDGIQQRNNVLCSNGHSVSFLVIAICYTHERRGQLEKCLAPKVHGVAGPKRFTPIPKIFRLTGCSNPASHYASASLEVHFKKHCEIVGIRLASAHASIYGVTLLKSLPHNLRETLGR